MSPETMRCPQCGAPMNRHAEKPVEPSEAEAAIASAAILGVMIEEAHSCPGCGCNASRRTTA